MQGLSYMLGWCGPIIGLVGYFTSGEPLALVIGLVMYLIELCIEWKKVNSAAKCVELLFFTIGSIVSAVLGEPFYIGGIIVIEIYSLIVSLISLPETIQLTKLLVSENCKRNDLPDEFLEYQNMGGWIAFFFITLIFGTITEVISIIITIYTHTAYDSTIYVLNLAITCVGVALNILCYWMIEIKDTSFVKFYTTATFLILLENVLVGWVQETFPSTVSNSVISIIWVAYFHLSKRAAVYFNYKTERFIPSDTTYVENSCGQLSENAEQERQKHIEQMIKAEENQKEGRECENITIPICLSSIVKHIVSQQKARENLSEEEYQKFYSVYHSYDIDIYETPMTISEYRKMVTHIAEKFKAVVPWEKVCVALPDTEFKQELIQNIPAEKNKERDLNEEAEDTLALKTTHQKAIMFCRKCGNKLPAECNFCPRCGTRVEEVKEV